MLHIINKSPFEKNSFSSAVNNAADGSTFLLIEDGVYAGLSNTTFSDTLTKAQSIGTVFVLMSDAKARGIHEKLDNGVTQTNYAGFVDLVIKNERVQSWL